MKKFLKLFILSIICLLPVMVEAKANYSLDYEITNKEIRNFIKEIIVSKEVK